MAKRERDEVCVFYVCASVFVRAWGEACICVYTCVAVVLKRITENEEIINIDFVNEKLKEKTDPEKREGVRANYF